MTSGACSPFSRRSRRRARACRSAGPKGKNWQVEVFAASGRFVLLLAAGPRENLIYLDVVEKEFGVPATTRTWNTVEKIRKILQRG